jgi:hypothetical protein
MSADAAAPDGTDAFALSMVSAASARRLAQAPVVSKRGHAARAETGEAAALGRSP